MKRQLLAFCVSIASAAALADAPRLPREPDPAWLEECGSCHVAYPPALLVADDWRRLMAGLERHFGTNASLDALAAARIGAFLERNASTRGERNASAQLRITETRWFVREHDDIPAATWRSPQVKSAANCGACHRGAERGRYDEREITLPSTRR